MDSELIRSVRVAAARLPAEWGAELAADVHEVFNRRPGSMALADLVRVPRIFPPDWTERARRDRLGILYGNGVQVDNIVYTLDAVPSRRYQANKILKAARGVLSPHPVAAPSGASHVANIVPRFNSLVLADTDPPRDDIARILESLALTNGALVERVGVLEDALAMAGADLSGTKFFMAEERERALRDRIITLEKSVARMTEEMANMRRTVEALVHVSGGTRR